MCPSSFLEFTKWFGQMVQTPLGTDINGVEKWVCPGPYLSASQRFELYHEQYWLRLFDELQQDYPSLVRLFGEEDFEIFIAEPYFLKYPPNHWSRRCLGTRLPQWIEECYHEEDKTLIHQMALVDDAFDRSETSSLNANFVAFREKLLEKEPAYWAHHPFPKIICR